MNQNTMTSCTVSNREKTRILTGVAMLSAVAYILAFIEIPIPLSPSFAKMDVSDLPALLASFAYGPMAGIAVELVKNGLQLFTTATGGIGELANFLMGCAIVIPAGLIYKVTKTRRGALLGCIVGSVCIGIAAAILNYFVLLPMYSIFMPIDQVIASFASFMPFIQTKLDVVLLNALPMNFLKGAIISGLTMLLYQPLRPILKGAQ